MQIVLQRVKRASVEVDNQIISSIENGYLLLVGIEDGDTEETVEKNARKISNLRIFEDEHGKMNLNIHQADGSILSVSQFTLCASMEKGNRPGFDKAAQPDQAIRLFGLFNQKLRDYGITVKTGEFKAYMQVSLVNDGPVTFVINHT